MLTRIKINPNKFAEFTFEALRARIDLDIYLHISIYIHISILLTQDDKN